MALPIPLVEPVTTAVLPVRSKRGDMAVSGLRMRQPDHATARSPSVAPVYVNGAVLAYPPGLGVSRRCGGARMTAPHEAVQANGSLRRGGGRRNGTLPTDDANAR